MEKSWFAPLPDSLLEWKEELSDETLGARLSFHSEGSFPSIEGVKIALISVSEYRGSQQTFEFDFTAFRKELYQLCLGNWDLEIVDLGMLKSGAELSDTHAALSSSLSDLMKEGVIPIVIGGSHDLSLPLYSAYRKLEQSVNLAMVDAKIDLKRLDDRPSSDNFLAHILLEQPNILFNYSHIAHQSYFVPDDTEGVLQKMHFDFLRLGRLREDRTLIEPILRDADILSFDVKSIRGHEMPAQAKPGPNGLAGDEVCAITRYAGISDKLTSLGLFEYRPDLDERNLGGQLLAQMIWYFIEGVSLRKNDFPFGDRSDYQKFTVALEQEDDLVFFKSPRSGRWWMEVPFPDSASSKFKRHCLVPCNYEDYERALTGEVPERWWQALHKLI